MVKKIGTDSKKDMIIVCFHGGLGNQMYEYMYYQYLRQIYPRCVIKADLERYKYIPLIEHNGFELERIFAGIELEKASLKEILKCGGTYERQKAGVIDIIKKNVWNRLLNRKKRAQKRGAISEEEWCNRSEEERLMIMNTQDIWLSGFWVAQTDIFNNVFKFKNVLDSRNLLIAKMMKDYESVSIHVRRGDYVGTEFDVVTMKYYEEAIKLIYKITSNPVFFVFSDDKQYIKDNFYFLNNYIIVEKNVGENAYKDMQLMTYCKNNIICNSTFSTWGALLNCNNEFNVVYPKIYERSIPKVKKGNWIGI